VKQDHVVLDELDGRVRIMVDDWELFDFIEDHLAKHGFEYDYFKEEIIGSRRSFVMHFQVGIDPIQLRGAMKLIDPSEIQRIWRINN